MSDTLSLAIRGGYRGKAMLKPIGMWVFWPHTIEKPGKKVSDVTHVTTPAEDKQQKLLFLAKTRLHFELAKF